MNSRNDDIRKVENALVTIKGNTLRCQNSVFSIHNIVSFTFDELMKERARDTDYLFKFIIYTLVYVPLFSLGSYFWVNIMSWITGDYFLKEALSSIELYIFNTVSGYYLLVHSFLIFLLFCTFFLLYLFFDKWKHRNTKYYIVTYVVKIVFVNNFSLFLVSKTEKFTKDTVDFLYSFISNPKDADKNELVINFSDSSINIKEAVGSNIIGGNVEGDVTNG